MYPTLSEGVTIGTFHYEGSDTTYYYVENAQGEKFEISYKLWDALLHADGTKPLKLPNNEKKKLPELEKHGIVRTSRFIWGGIFSRFILFSFGDRLYKCKKMCKAINKAMPGVSILTFAICSCLMALSNVEIDFRFNVWTFLGLAIISTVIHEMGHLVTGIAYDYKINNAGFVLLGIIPIGAYIAHEEKDDATKGEKIQLARAGVELNLMLASLCLLIVILFYPASFTIVSVANFNVFLVCINILPIAGLDGESVLSVLCGVKCISEEAEKWLCNKNLRQKLLSSGLHGYLYFLLFALIYSSKLFPILLACLEAISIYFLL